MASEMGGGIVTTMIINIDCLEYIRECSKGDFKIIFMDPPDNIGLGYNGYQDNLKPGEYYDRLELLVREALRVGDVIWLSYYWKHDLEIKYRVRRLLSAYWQAKTFIWRFTFGQHCETDCGSGYRPILRIANQSVKFDADAIRVPSLRQTKYNDPRANPDGRVPDDVFEVPRVTGNAKERRSWHPTQHPEALIERILKLSGPGRVLDCFGGTGTVARVCKRLGWDCVTCEIDPTYCEKINAELD